jgi:hypothetical protein
LIAREQPATKLHRGVVLLVAVALAGFVCGRVLLRVLAEVSAWAGCVRRTTVAPRGLTCVLQAFVAVRELRHYDPEARTTQLA